MTKIYTTEGYKIVAKWMASQGMQPFTFQKKTWLKYAQGYNGLVVAPTGMGKTFSVFFAVLIDFLNAPHDYPKGLKLLWVTPLRSLSNDLARVMQEAIDGIGLDWIVEVRNGDTDPKIKQRQSRSMPEVLIVTPESLHLLIAQKKRRDYFKNLKAIVVDEWHELLSSKRGVMMELALAYLKQFKPSLKTWAISATIGNLEEALDVLVRKDEKRIIIQSKEKKKLQIIPVLPKGLDLLPWAGHLGTRQVEQVVPIILKSRSTLLFTNTRSQSEHWYQLLLAAHPDFAGQMALHHGSIDAGVRNWIEESLSKGKLKVVIATSSLDLGVDFKPVDTVIQIGSSKGVARFIQRAGRSGHSPSEVSKIYFVPTYSLELIEVSALKEAVKIQSIEERSPLLMCFDVLVQFMVTMALGGGFTYHSGYELVKSCFSFQWITLEEWEWCLFFISKGGEIGGQYPDFHKVVLSEEGLYIVEKRRIAMLHRLNIGVIVSDAMIKVKFESGGYIGMVEESFISRLKERSKFILAGRILEFIRLRDMVAHVRMSHGNAITPSWLGGRLPMSANLGALLRMKISQISEGVTTEKELNYLAPLFTSQAEYSYIPTEKEFLIERIKTKEGYHLFMYPFEGRQIHEIMATLVAYRISKLYPISFTIAMNDYGFELFSDQEIKLSIHELDTILNTDQLMKDVIESINATEMARRKFRDIAVIAGYVLQRYYNTQQNNKSLQSSSGIIFSTLEEYEPQNLLLRQAYTEVFNTVLEEVRLKKVFERIANSKKVFRDLQGFTPLSFPIKVDSLRHSLSSEKLRDRIKKMKEQTLKYRK